MEISGKGVTPINLNAYANPVQEAQKVNSGNKEQDQSGGTRDKVNLSTEAREAQKAMELLKTMPDENVNKVNEIKTEVDAGTYRVDGQKTAFQMMSDTLENGAVMQQFAIDV